MPLFLRRQIVVCYDFGIMIARYIIKKPRNLYPIPECTYGVEGIGCEIVVAVGVG